MRGYEPAIVWFQDLKNLPYVSGISVIETTFGAPSLIELRRVRTLLSTFPIVWPESIDFQFTANQLAEYRLSRGLGMMDALSAAVALRLNLPIATFNRKHFEVIKGIRTIQPYVR